MTTWTIQWMKTSTQPINGFNEVVLDVGWICYDFDTTYQASVYNSLTLVPPQEGDANFVPYANLTEADVLNWIWTSGVNKTATEEAVAQMIVNQKNPPVIQPPLPWAV